MLNWCWICAAVVPLPQTKEPVAGALQSVVSLFSLLVSASNFIQPFNAPSLT
ncbi:MAG TPA: hypothetical protein V6D19_03245 [Stenomitos sp.]